MSAFAEFSDKPQQQNLIARRRRNYRQVRKLAQQVESSLAILAQNPAAPVFAQVAHDCSQQAFALSRKWANK